MTDTRTQGLEMLKKLLPGIPDDVISMRDGGIADELGELSLDHVFGALWTRPGLDRRSRSLVTLGALIALRASDELKLHFQIALNNGLALEEIEEVIYHMTAYAGYPAAVNARKLANEVLTPLMLTLDQALDETRTGDLWLFRGGSGPDRAIQTLTNAPVNHVGMTVAIDDLPPLIWHAELGDKLVDLWTGSNHRGVQLNDLRQAVQQWTERYHQRCWLRQLTPDTTRQQENALLRVIARMDGTAFPTTARLTGRWFRGRLPTINDWVQGNPVRGQERFASRPGGAGTNAG